jgi:hypothetical protein
MVLDRERGFHLNKKDELFDKLPETTLRYTIVALQYIFLIILIYIAGSMIFLFISNRLEFITQIVGWSITGFFAFFMGYFGYSLAQHITIYFSKKLMNKEK